MSHYLSYEQMVQICEKINEKYIPDGEAFFEKVEELFHIEEPVTFQQFMVMTMKGLLSVVDEEIEKIEQKATIKPSCLKGCAHCCYFPIIVTQAEGKMLVDYIETLPEKAREDMKAHLKDYFSTYEAKIKDVCSMPFEGDFKKTYIQKQLPCPFLDTNSNTCKAYEVRPIPCRTYLNYCDPIVCAENDVPKEPFSYEFFYAFYMQALNEVIQELVEEEEFPFHYPQDLVTYDYLPNLLKKYLHEIR